MYKNVRKSNANILIYQKRTSQLFFRDFLLTVLSISYCLFLFFQNCWFEKKIHQKGIISFSVKNGVTVLENIIKGLLERSTWAIIFIFLFWYLLLLYTCCYVTLSRSVGAMSGFEMKTKAAMLVSKT